MYALLILPPLMLSLPATKVGSFLMKNLLWSSLTPGRLVKIIKKAIHSFEQKSKLWRTGARRLFVTGILSGAACSDGSRAGMIPPLQAAWGPIFQAQPSADFHAACERLAPFVQDTASTWTTTFAS